MHSKGQGVPQDYKEAVKWYRLSAEQGVALDYIQAYKWFYIAGNKGYEKGRTNRVIVEKLMTPDQIAEAQKLAREWTEEQGKK